MRRCLVVLCVLTTASLVRADTAVELLAGVAANARFPAVTGAALRLEGQHGEATTTETAVLFGNGRTIYVETSGGTRALVRPSKIVVRSGTRIVRSPIGARLGRTDLLLEDLVPLTPSYLEVPQVSDTGPTGTVVTGAPAAPSARVLVVFTIDPDLRVVTRVKYYEKTISNLAAFRRDEDFVEVAGHQRPTRITVDRPHDDTSTRVALDWRSPPAPIPATISLATLRGPSLLPRAP